MVVPSCSEAEMGDVVVGHDEDGSPWAGIAVCDEKLGIGGNAST
jgi:hypothetical protein